MKILVTGGAGFIGSRLVCQLLNEKHDVCVLDNISTGKIVNIPNEVEFFEGDACNQEIVERALVDVEGVFHLAAIPSVIISENKPLTNQNSGEVALLSVLNASLRNKKVRRIVYASSAAVYGNCLDLPIDENTQINPISNYAVSKVAGELYLRAACSKQHSLDAVSLRFFNVYGPGQQPDSSYAGVITSFFRCITENIPPVIYGDGNQKRDFIWVDDVVNACILAMMSKEKLAGQSINIGSGLDSTVCDVWAALKNATQSTLVPEFRASRPGEVRDSLADCRIAEAVLGFRAKTNLYDGIIKMIETQDTFRPCIKASKST